MYKHYKHIMHHIIVYKLYNVIILNINYGEFTWYIDLPKLKNC